MSGAISLHWPWTKTVCPWMWQLFGNREDVKGYRSRYGMAIGLDKSPGKTLKRQETLWSRIPSICLKRGSKNSSFQKRLMFQMVLNSIYLMFVCLLEVMVSLCSPGLPQTPDPLTLASEGLILPHAQLTYSFFNFLFFYLLETGSHATQADLDLTVSLRLTFNFCISFLHLQRDEIKAIQHQAWLKYLFQ